MECAKKFTSFEDLKSSKKKDADFEAKLKKHTDLERVIREISSSNVKDESSASFNG